MKAGKRFEALANLLNREMFLKRMPQIKLAEGLEIDGIADSTIHRTTRNILSGERLPPKRDTKRYLEHFAMKLEIPLEELESGYNKDLKQTSEKPSVAQELNKLLADNASNTTSTQDSISLFSNDRSTIALVGKQSFSNAMIAMLENLKGVQNDDSNKKIYLTFQGRKSVFSQENDKEKNIEKRWRKAIESAISQGYKFIHLIRMGNDRARIQDIVLQIVSFISEQNGSYELRTLKDNFILQPPYGMFLVPFVDQDQAIISFSVNDGEMTDSGILTKDATIVALVKKHIEILESQSTEVFQRIETYPELLDKISEADPQSSERYVFLKRLPEIIRPLEWYRLDSNWAKQSFNYLGLKTNKEKKEYIEKRRNRRVYIEECLKKHPCYFFCIKSLIFEGLVVPTKEGKPNRKVEHYFIPTQEEKLQQLDNLLKLVQTKNFNIALLEDTDIVQDDFNRIKLDHCEVIDGNLVLIEVPITIDIQEKHQSRWYLTQNRIVTRAFQSYFASLWDIIPESKKNTNDIYDSINLLRNTFS